MKSNRGKLDEYGRTYEESDRVACLVYFDDHTGAVSIKFMRNGEDLGDAFEDQQGCIFLRRVSTVVYEVQRTVLFLRCSFLYPGRRH
jgi:hypothetical protein